MLKQNGWSNLLYPHYYNCYIDPVCAGCHNLIHILTGIILSTKLEYKLININQIFLGRGDKKYSITLYEILGNIFHLAISQIAPLRIVLNNIRPYIK